MGCQLLSKVTASLNPVLQTAVIMWVCTNDSKMLLSCLRHMVKCRWSLQWALQHKLSYCLKLHANGGGAVSLQLLLFLSACVFVHVSSSSPCVGVSRQVVIFEFSHQLNKKSSLVWNIWKSLIIYSKWCKAKMSNGLDLQVVSKY